jgi:hypothetical protein
LQLSSHQRIAKIPHFFFIQPIEQIDTAKSIKIYQACQWYFTKFPFLRVIANRLIFSNSYEVKEIVRETSKEIFCMGSELGSNHYMPVVKHPFDHSKRPFKERSGCHEVMQLTYRTFGRTGVLCRGVKGVYTPNSDLLPFLAHVPSRLRRVFAASPRGLSAEAWPGSDVMNDAS